MKTEHLLIIRFGDRDEVAAVVPTVRSLAAGKPAMRVTILTQPAYKGLFEGLPENVGVMVADMKNEYKGIKGLSALYRRLLAKNFTGIADFQRNRQSRYLCMRFGAAGYKRAHLHKQHKHHRKFIGKRKKEEPVLPLPSLEEGYSAVLRKLGYGPATAAS